MMGQCRYNRQTSLQKNQLGARVAPNRMSKHTSVQHGGVTQHISNVGYRKSINRF